MAKDLTPDELKQVIATVQALSSQELVALKAHVLVEVALTRVLAARLGTQPEQLPRLRFEHLARLAFAGVDDTPGLATLVRLLGDLRNTYAHDALPKGDAAVVRRIVEGVGVKDWPATPSAQLEAFKRSVEVIFVALLNLALQSSMTPEAWADFEVELRDRARATVQELFSGRS